MLTSSCLKADIRKRLHLAVANAQIFHCKIVFNMRHANSRKFKQAQAVSRNTNRSAADMIRKAHLVLCMTADHVHAAKSLVHDEPEQIAKIHRLDPDRDMDDPIGMEQAAYDHLAQRLSKLIPQRLEELLSDENRSGIRPSR